MWLRSHLQSTPQWHVFSPPLTLKACRTARDEVLVVLVLDTGLRVGSELAAQGCIWWGQRGPLERDGVKRAYNRLFHRAGITGRKLGPHTLRHTFGTNYVRSSGGVRQLQYILGHQRIETTMIYVHLAGKDV